MGRVEVSLNGKPRIPEKKRLMDSLRVIARNVFYQTLQPFKKAYNNYRDDVAGAEPSSRPLSKSGIRPRLRRRLEDRAESSPLS